jgi:hypothetical protein
MSGDAQAQFVVPAGALPIAATTTVTVAGIISQHYRITSQPLKQGFMNVLQDLKPLLPSKGGKIHVFLEGLGDTELTYNPKVGRIYGLTKWYRETKARVGDYVSIQFPGPSKSYYFSLIRQVITDLQFESKRKESVPKYWQAISDRFLFVGKGGEYQVIGKLLELSQEVYVPVVDRGGVDALIRFPNGSYKEIQVKTRSKKDGGEIFDTHMAVRPTLFVVLHISETDDFWILPSEVFYDNRSKSSSVEKNKDMRLVLTEARKKELHPYHNNWYLLKEAETLGQDPR